MIGLFVNAWDWFPCCQVREAGVLMIAFANGSKSASLAFLFRWFRHACAAPAAGSCHPGLSTPDSRSIAIWSDMSWCDSSMRGHVRL